MKPFYILVLAVIFGVFSSCKETAVPKPNAYLNLSYEKADYKDLNLKGPYNFELSHQAVFTVDGKSWANISYPKLKADINITYQKVENDIYSIIADAEKITFKHTQKADQIEVRSFENEEKKVYARIFDVSGNAASPIQFQVTDSLKHFISGSLYFRVAPNYDSIIPAIEYVKKDIRHVIETLEWNP